MSKRSLRDDIRHSLTQTARVLGSAWQRLPISRQIQSPLAVGARITSYFGGVQERSIASTSSADSIRTLLTEKREQFVFVEGVAGGGKTAALKWLGAQLAEESAQSLDDGAFLPVYVDLGRFTRLVGRRSLSQLLDREFTRLKPVNLKAFAQHRQNIVFLLDGLDLLPQPTRRQFVEEAVGFMPGPVVLASRPDPAVSASMHSAGRWSRVLLGILDKEVRERWLHEHTQPDARNRLRLLVDENPQLTTLLDIPLMFAMAASVCIDGEIGAPFRFNRFPGRTGILDGFVAHALDRAVSDGRLGAHAKHRVNEVTPLFEAVCYQAQRSGVHDRIITGDVGKHLVRIAAENMSLTPEAAWTMWRSALRYWRAAGIVARDGEEIVFLHQQFAEFMAGGYVADALREAHTGGYLETELVVHLNDREQDGVTAHALAKLSAERETAPVVSTAFRALAEIDVADACELLCRSGSDYAVEVTNSIMLSRSDRSPMERLDAIFALALAPGPASCRALREIARDHRELSQLRIAAVKTLGKIPREEGQGTLTELAGDTSLPGGLRAASVLAGGKLPDRDAVFLLSAVVGDSGEDETIRQDAVEAMGAMESPAAIAALKKLLGRTGSQTVDLIGRAVLARAEARMRGDAPADDPYEATRVTQGGTAADPDVADLADLDKLLKSFANAHEPREKASSFGKLIEVCRRGGWQALHERALSRGFCSKQLSEFARAAGRRVFPEWITAGAKNQIKTLRRGQWPALLERLDAIDQRIQGLSSLRPETQRLSPDTVLAEYLRFRVDNNTPERISLRDAEEWARGKGPAYQWGRSTLQKTKLWISHQKMLAKRKDERRVKS